MSRVRIRVAIVTAIALMVGISTATPAFATHSWGDYHWGRQSNPVTVKLGDNVSSEWDSYLVTASSDWSKDSTTILNAPRVAGSVSSRDLRKCPATTGQVEVCNSKYGYNGWLGVAGIYLSGSHITKAYVKLNDSYYGTSTYNTAPWRSLVMCQEVGHTFGLAHQDENFSNANLGTCMDYTNDPDGGLAYGPSNEHPNTHDYDQLAAIYEHLDSSTTPGGSKGSGKGRPALPAPSQAACDGEHGIPANAGPSDGDVFVCDLGSGARQITHVFWIPRGLPGAH